MGLVALVFFVQDFRPWASARLVVSTETIQGMIVGVEATNFSENERTVYRYDFRFRTRDGERITAHSYSTAYRGSAEERAMVEYVPEQPAIARLRGTRLSLTPIWVPAMVGSFFLIGAAFFGASTVRGLRQLAILRWGKVAGAQILSQAHTGVRINEVPVIKYVYEFDTSDGRNYVGESRALPTPHLGDEAEEPVVYLPSNPERSMLVDALPLRHPLDVDNRGQWMATATLWPTIVYGLIALIALALVGVILLRVGGLF